MRRLGIIGGTGLTAFTASDSPSVGRWLISSSNSLIIDTEWGEVPITASILESGSEKRELFFLQRHHRVPVGSKIPHNIEHRANVAAIVSCGVDAVLAVCSVGGIAPHFKPGFVALASQYMDVSGLATSFHQDEAIFTSMTNPFDRDMNAVLLSVLRDSQPEFSNLLDEQFTLTYWHGTGPQYETPAEIQMIAKLGGDCVGMTLGAEAKLMAEKKQRFAALLISSNYASGTDPEDPSAELNHNLISSQANERLMPVWACISHLLE